MFNKGDANHGQEADEEARQEGLQVTIRFGGRWLAWLAHLFAPRFVDEMIRRSAVTGKASVSRGGKAASITAAVERKFDG